MKLLVAFLLTYLFVFQVNFVKSGVLLDRISDTRHKIRCGIHRVGGLVVNRNQNTECDDKPHEIETNGIPDTKVTTPRAVTDKHEHDITKGTVTENPQQKNATMAGRRIIAAGSNCPEGERADGKGNCREEY